MPGLLHRETEGCRIKIWRLWKWFHWKVAVPGVRLC